MVYLEAPGDIGLIGDRSLFMAGGITDCPDWQLEMADRLLNLNITVVNPRNPKFNTKAKDASLNQIAWEKEALTRCRMISFWFPKETLCPITLYELGTWIHHPINKTIFIGCHPEYKRREDVIIQTNLSLNRRALDESWLADSVEKLADQIIRFVAPHVPIRSGVV